MGGAAEWQSLADGCLDRVGLFIGGGAGSLARASHIVRHRLY